MVSVALDALIGLLTSERSEVKVDDKNSEKWSPPYVGSHVIFYVMAGQSLWFFLCFLISWVVCPPFISLVLSHTIPSIKKRKMWVLKL